MKVTKLIGMLGLAIALTACSGAPSDADVEQVAKQSVQELERQFAPLGIQWTDVFDTKVKVTNKAKQENGRWLIEAETAVTAKKDLKDVAEGAQLGVMALAGNIKKGELLGGRAMPSKFYMQKGDKGWIATN